MGANRAIGIDLGTTYSCAAIMEGPRPCVVKSALGYATIPSVVTFNQSGEILVGQLAEQRMVLEPQNTIYGSKRLLGRTFLKSAVERFQPQFRYKLVADQDGFIAAQISERAFPLVEVASLILGEIRQASQRILDEPVTRAVITVPAYFNENQRALVREAGRLADLDVIRIINEPTAAVLAYGSGDVRQKLLVFDLGGGTFDVSVVEANNSVYTVLGVGGDTFLGGIDIDARLSDLIIKRQSMRLNREVELDPVNMARLLVAAQKAKHQLSAQQTTTVEIIGLILADGTAINVIEKITRKELEEATKDLCDRTMSVVKDVLRTANLSTTDIDEVLLVGGQTRMPILRNRLEALFGFEPSKRVHPDEVVALGAAIAAESGSSAVAPLLLDVLPIPIGVSARDGRFVPFIPKNTPVPHEVQVNVTVRPGIDTVKLALFQGHKLRAVDNEYLGALVIDGLEAVTEPVECVLRFLLNEESLLKVRASIEALGIKREVKLATKLTVDEVLTEINTNRVALRVPEAPGAEGPVKVKPTAPAATPPGDAKPAAPAATPPVKTKPAAPAATPPNTSPTGPVRMMHKQRSWFGRMLDWFRQRGRRGERGRGRDGS